MPLCVCLVRQRMYIKGKRGWWEEVVAGTPKMRVSFGSFGYAVIYFFFSHVHLRSLVLRTNAQTDTHTNTKAKQSNKKKASFFSPRGKRHAFIVSFFFCSSSHTRHLSLPPASCLHSPSFPFTLYIYKITLFLSLPFSWLLKRNSPTKTLKTLIQPLSPSLPPPY